ncbi:unnamed protein product [Clavelina lepadiformis]|uniref:Uncharacterized protein n=1 Tax=Clavelina lepadiformis TaxID=159417 RepID=A0ABP0GCJ2_CLALP
MDVNEKLHTNAPSYHWIIKVPFIGSGSCNVKGYVDLNPNAGRKSSGFSDLCIRRHYLLSGNN